MTLSPRAIALSASAPNLEVLRPRGLHGERSARRRWSTLFENLRAASQRLAGGFPFTGVLAAPPVHPAWPHHHVSREGELFKAVWITLVLVGAGAYVVVSVWRGWRRRKRQSEVDRRRHGDTNRGRKRRGRGR